MTDTEKTASMLASCIQHGRGWIRQRWCVLTTLLLLACSCAYLYSMKTPVSSQQISYQYVAMVQAGKRNKQGLSLNVDLAALHHLGIPERRFIKLSNYTMDKFVFATAASWNHFEESMDAVASMQANFPGHWIFYFDLGLTQSQINRLSTVCSVIYRKFRFDLYPKHVGNNLRTCAWKPLIIQELLKEFGAVFWMDSSIRLKSKDISSFYKVAKRTDGGVMMLTTGHSIYAATHEGTYKYLPADTRKLTVPMFGAGSLLIYNSRTMHDRIMLWYVLCALEQKCIAPTDEINCKFKHPMNDWAGCHRYDQSVVNILFSNLFKYKSKFYSAKEDNVATLRQVTHMFKIQMCG